MEDIMGKSWLLFQLHKVHYAVAGDAVISILREVGKVTVLPQTDPAIRGVMLLRGSVVPLLDLRVLLKLPTVEDEFAEFKKTLDAHRGYPFAYAELLREAAKTGKTDRLITDPHACEFGKWYDTLEAQNRTMAFHMRKLASPHEELHQLSEELEELLKRNGTLHNDIEIEELINDMDERVLPNLTALLDESEKVFRESTRQMAVTVEYQGEKLGLLVDNVEAVRTFSQNLVETEEDENRVFPYEEYQDERLGVVRILPLKELFALAQNGKA